MTEVIGKIHDLQNWVLANGVARWDHGFRLMGCMPWKEGHQVPDVRNMVPESRRV